MTYPNNIPRPEHISLSSDNKTFTCKKCWVSIDIPFSNFYAVTNFVQEHRHPIGNTVQTTPSAKPWPVYPD